MWILYLSSITIKQSIEEKTVQYTRLCRLLKKNTKRHPLYIHKYSFKWIVENQTVLRSDHALVALFQGIFCKAESLYFN
jgi:hypothetical protein